MPKPSTPAQAAAQAVKPSKAPITLSAAPEGIAPKYEDIARLEAAVQAERAEKLALQNQLASATEKLSRARLALAQMGARSDGDLAAP